MLRLMNRYRAELGVEATPAELEAIARATVRQLEQDTAIAINRSRSRRRQLTFDVVVTNLTGHKFPTGYPSRRAGSTWRRAISEGRALRVGTRDRDRVDRGQRQRRRCGRVRAALREITRPDEVQIYESIMGTPPDAPTTGLLQATHI